MLSGVTTATDVQPTYPMTRACPLDLPPAYDRIRMESPITKVRLDFDGREVWIVTKHEHACALLSDPRISSEFSTPGFPRRLTPEPPIPGTFIRIDPPDHTRVRGALVAEFKPKRVEALRPAIQAIADELFDGLLARKPPVDLIDAMALPFPSMVICELLGVPYDDRPFFHKRIKVIGVQRKTLERHAEVRAELERYIEDLVGRREKQAEVTTDILGRLIVRQREVGDISRAEVVGIATLLLIAGYETIANMIGLGTLALLHHREQFEELKADPSKLPQAIEEMLRYQTVIAFGLRRAVTDDIEIGGQTIRKGDGVIVLLDAANRDGCAFPEPSRFDIHRKVDHHLAFGFGIHACVGQMLARLELSIFWSTLLKRVPTLRLAVPVEQLPFRHEAFVYGVHELPVAW
jgi:cytochrome P450